MGMRRLFVREMRVHDSLCTITGGNAHYVSNVLRMKRGDRIILMDGEGRRFQCSIRSVNPREVHMVIERALPAPLSSPVEIVLGTAVLKSRAMDFLVQKASELGVSRIVPFTCERSVVRLPEEKIPAKLRHWQEIGYNAAAQSDRNIPAEIEPVLSLQKALNLMEQAPGPKVMLWEEEEAKDLKEVLRRGDPPGCVVVLVGPEGGFTGGEVRLARNAGFETVTMGKRILRSETASAAAVAIVQYELGDLNAAAREAPAQGAQSSSSR